MNLIEAKEIGQKKLSIDSGLFERSLGVAREMGVLGNHLGPMTLALALLGLAKATDPKDLESELTDALSLVAKAEKEWKMEQSLGSKGRLS